MPPPVTVGRPSSATPEAKVLKPTLRWNLLLWVLLAFEEIAAGADEIEASPARVVTSLEVPVLGSVSRRRDGAVWALLLPSPLSARDEKSPSTGEAMRSFCDESAGWRFRIPCRFMTGLAGALLGLEDDSMAGLIDVGNSVSGFGDSPPRRFVALDRLEKVGGQAERRGDECL